MANDQGSVSKGSTPEGAFVVASRYEDGQVTVDLRGELDIGGSDRLSTELETVMTSSLDRLVINASELTFIDSAGLHVLVVASEEAQARGIAFEVTGVTSLVRRVVEMAGLDGVLLPEQQA